MSNPWIMLTNLGHRFILSSLNFFFFFKFILARGFPDDGGYVQETQRYKDVAFFQTTVYTVIGMYPKRSSPLYKKTLQ